MLTCPGGCEELKSAWETLSFACLGPLISLNLPPPRPRPRLPPQLEQHPVLPTLSSPLGFSRRSAFHAEQDPRSSAL